MGAAAPGGCGRAGTGSGLLAVIAFRRVAGKGDAPEPDQATARQTGQAEARRRAGSAAGAAHEAAGSEAEAEAEAQRYRGAAGDDPGVTVRASHGARADRASRSGASGWKGHRQARMAE